MSQPAEIAGSQAIQPIPGLPWYHVSDAHSPALDELARRFRLHELQIEDCRHRPQRAKSEEREEYLFCVLKGSVGEESVRFHDFDLFIGRDFLVTVDGTHPGLVDRIARRAATGGMRDRLDRLLYTVVDTLVDEYLPILDRTADEISAIESAVLVDPQPAMLRRILRLKRRLIEFRRVATSMREVVTSIMRRQEGIVGDDLDVYWRDVYDHLVRTVEMIETYRDLLTGSLEVYLSSIANRTNETMKVLTIYGLVTLPFVVVTGFFGMNLQLPWAESRYGAWFVLALMIGLAAGLLWYFRRRRLL